MKKIFYFLLFCVVCYLFYTRCGNKESDDKVIKQVTVTAKTANLRTGPGTNHELATRDSTATPWQVSRGTKLDVVGEKNGWYKVRIDDQTVYIKKTLCDDPNSKKTAGKRQKRNSDAAAQSPSAAPSSDAPAEQPSDEDGVVEEVTTGQYDGDDVVF